MPVDFSFTLDIVPPGQGLLLWGDENGVPLALHDGATNLAMWGDHPTSATLPQLSQTSNPDRNDTFLVDDGSQSAQATIHQLRQKFNATQHRIYVNDYYDGVHATGPIGVSRTLTDLGYATLGDAQVDYPAATALSDQVDWCVLTQVNNAMFDIAAPPSNFSNFASFLIQLDGHYCIDKTWVVNAEHAEIAGVVASPSNSICSGETVIQLIGAGGTLEAPIYAVDYFQKDQFGAAPPGWGTTGVLGTGSLDIHDIKLCGNFADVTANVQDLSEYKSGIRVGAGALMRIHHTVFCGSLWDGCIIFAPQLYFIFENNYITNIHRDAFSNWFENLSFSTTIWTRENHFEKIGRYAVNHNIQNVQPTPVQTDNVFIGIEDSFFHQNPSWFVHGCPTYVVYLGCTMMNDVGNWYDLGDSPAYWAEMMLTGQANDITIRDSNMTRLMIATGSRTEARTSGASMAQKPYGPDLSIDLTDNLNWKVGVGADIGSTTDKLTLDNLRSLRNIFTPDGISMPWGANCTFINLNADAWVTGTIAGTPTTPAISAATWASTTNYYRLRSEGLPSVVQPTTPIGWFYQAVNVDGVSGSSDPFPSKAWAITGITKASPAVVTYTGSGGPSNGDHVLIDFVVGMTQVNSASIAPYNDTTTGTFTVANVNTGAKTFQLSGIDSSGYGAYTSGGAVLLSQVADGTVLWRPIKPLPGGADWEILPAPADATPVQITFGIVTKALVNSRIGAAFYAMYGGAGATGSFLAKGPTSLDYPEWQALTPYTNKFGSGFTTVGMRVVPTSGNFNGFYYQCITAGTSGASEPTWPGFDGTVMDGTVEWKWVDFIYNDTDDGKVFTRETGVTSQRQTGAPTTNFAFTSQQQWETTPTAGGKLLRVNVNDGCPGVWKTALGIAS